MERAIRWSAGGIAIAMSLYHMWFAASAPPEAMIFRGTHLLFALVLVFLFFPAGGREGPRKLLWLDMALIADGNTALTFTPPPTATIFSLRSTVMPCILSCHWLWAIL